MKPILYCVVVEYIEGTPFSDIDFIRERIMLKSVDRNIQYIGNECFLFTNKDNIRTVFESLYREFGHIKEYIDVVTLLHVLDIETMETNIVFDPVFLH